MQFVGGVNGLGHGVVDAREGTGGGDAGKAIVIELILNGICTVGGGNERRGHSAMDEDEESVENKELLFEHLETREAENEDLAETEL